MTATSFDQIHTGQEGLNETPSEVVAICRFVITDGKVCIVDDPEQGIGISENPTEKEFTYTAHLARKGWKASFGCAYATKGVLGTVKILDLNDDVPLWKERRCGGRKMKCKDSSITTLSKAEWNRFKLRGRIA